MREMVMCCGIEGSEASRADDFEASVLDVIRKTADEGVSEESSRRFCIKSTSSARSNGRWYALRPQLMPRALGARLTTVTQLQRLT